MLHISETLSILIFILPVETRLENGILSSVKPLLLLFYLMDILHFICAVQCLVSGVLILHEEE